MFDTVCPSTIRRGARALLLAGVACTLLPPDAAAQVQLFQHRDFGGWSATFGQGGTFATIDIVTRGGINNQASSIKVAPGWKATLYSGDNQAGRSVTFTANDNAFSNDSFNDVLSSLVIEPANVVHAYQGCNFTGWKASFPAGNFNAAAIIARGGRDNDISSLQIPAGVTVRLFENDDLTGAGVTLQGDTPCLNPNDRTSSLTIIGAPGPDPTPTPLPAPGPCQPGVPERLEHCLARNHTEPMTLVGCNGDMAYYHDDGMLALPPAGTEWAKEFTRAVWLYLKDNYGTCSVPRDLPEPIGPGCERYGNEQLFNMFHAGTHGGGTIGLRFDSFTGFRNALDVGDSAWNVTNSTLHDVIVHEACHQVEGGSQGVHESPAFPIWGDSKWAEFCMYDFYYNTGRLADARRVYTQFTPNRTNRPPGTTGALWFRDWFYPLWQDGGGKPRVMRHYFELLSLHFPKRLENQDRNLIYTRRMTPGEYVHFTSGALGRDLSARAQQVFNGFDRAQFEQAQRDFPGVGYPGNPVNPNP